MTLSTKTVVSYIRTNAGLTLILQGKSYNVAKDAKNYSEVVAAVKEGKSEGDLLNLVNSTLLALHKATDLTPEIKIEVGAVTYKGRQVDKTLSERMVKMLEEGFELEPMANFLTNLMQNPSNRAVTELYAFLEKGNMPITPDGYFVAYKAVRDDYTDIHTGTFDNSIGQICEMDRNEVDDNRDEHCSTGLHFCSFDYLPNFANSDGHIMLLKINPADVVSIPSDYNDSKGRCCKYEVVDEYKDYYDTGKPCFDSTVFTPSSTTTSSPTLAYLVKVNGQEKSRYEHLIDAKHAAVDVATYEPAGSATVTVEDLNGKVYMSLN